VTRNIEHSLIGANDRFSFLKINEYEYLGKDYGVYCDYEIDEKLVSKQFEKMDFTIDIKNLDYSSEISKSVINNGGIEV